MSIISYQSSFLRFLYETILTSCIPLRFDYMLLGMGSDGHVGSLYPGRKEVIIHNNDQHVLTVDKKSPASITLSLPVMNNAREIRIVLTGEDKKDAAFSGATRAKSPLEFPACGVIGAKWLLDAGAGQLCVDRKADGIVLH